MIAGRSPRLARALVSVLEWDFLLGTIFYHTIGTKFWLCLCSFGLWQEVLLLPCNTILGFRPTGSKLVM